jgi:hypothetical protein
MAHRFSMGTRIFNPLPFSKLPRFLPTKEGLGIDSGRGVSPGRDAARACRKSGERVMGGK